MCDIAGPVDNGASSGAGRKPDLLMSRRAALVTGTGAGLAALAGAAQPVVVDAAAGYRYAQLGWRYCEKCRGMFHIPDGDAAGKCAAGGKHRPSLPNNYINYFYDGNGGSYGAHFTVPFARCGKCRGLIVYGGGGPTNACPKGGSHNMGDGQKYQVYAGPEEKPMMDGAWDYCYDCYLIFNWAGGAGGVCTVRDQHHRAGRSFGFALVY